MRLLIKILIIFLALPVFPQSSVGDKAPAVNLTDLKGKIVKLEDFKGKVVLLNFWATWCVPCRAEIPQLIKWQEEYQARGLQIIGITYPPTNRKRIREFAAKNKINYPVLFGSKRTKELFDTGDVMPYSVVIDKNGKITGQIEGVIFDDEFDEKIKPLLFPVSMLPE